MKVASAPIKNVWVLTREYGDLAGAGGVKDVALQLSCALARWTARRVSVVLPRYGFLKPDMQAFSPLPDPLSPDKDLEFEVDMNYVGEERRERVKVLHSNQERVDVYLLESARFAEKKAVYTYSREEEQGDPWKRQGDGHFDYFAMNLLLQKGALQLIILLRQNPDIIHCHDGHTAVLPAIIEETPWLKSYFRSTAFMVTIHNAGMGYHQDIADLPFAHEMTGLPWPVIMKSRLNGRFDPFVCASHYAVMNTVSENYARELQETEDDSLTGWLGHHLLQGGVTLEGITNGVDPSAFDPSNGIEMGLKASFDPRDDATIAGKLLCKKHFLEDIEQAVVWEGVEQFGQLSQNVECPLFTFIGRLSEQKGVDILLATFDRLFRQNLDFQAVILGSGNSAVESGLVGLTEQASSKGRICFLSGYSPSLANRVYGAGDFFVIPSRYEPCGLTDFIAQLFGNIPIVHRVGGLVKVIDGETGISYEDNSVESLGEAIQRAMEVYRNHEVVRSLQRQAIEIIETKHTWSVVMQRYLQLYKKARINKHMKEEELKNNRRGGGTDDH